MSFAFSESDLILAPIGEDESYSPNSDDDYEEGVVHSDDFYEDEEGNRFKLDGFELITESDVKDAKKDYKTAKLKTQTLAHEAQNQVAELSALLGKLNTGTATRNERQRVASLNQQLDVMKQEIDQSKSMETKAELKLLQSKTQLKLKTVQTAVKQREIRSVIKTVCHAEKVDLAFVVDCTDSMRRHIAAVKNSIKEIIRRVTATNGNLQLRLAFCAFRGVQDDKTSRPKDITLDFTTNVDTFERFVDGIKTWGGDCPLANVAGGIQRANRLSWLYPSRAVFVVCDFPCHGQEFHNHPFPSPYPRGTPGVNIVSEIRELSRKTARGGVMTLNFGRIQHYTDRMMERFKEYGLGFQCVDVSNVAQVTACVSQGIRKTIFKSMSVATTENVESIAFAPILNIEEALKNPKALMNGEETNGGGGGGRRSIEGGSASKNTSRSSSSSRAVARTAAPEVGRSSSSISSSAKLKVAPRPPTMMMQRTSSDISLKSYKIRKALPTPDEWKERPAVQVKVFCNREIASIEELRAPIDYGMLEVMKPATSTNGAAGGSGGALQRRQRPGGPLVPKQTNTNHNNTNPFSEELIQKTMWMRRAREPFAEGESRLAYHGQLSVKRQDLLASANTSVAPSKDKNAMVCKPFKHVGKGVNNREQYTKQMEVSTIALFLAREYNASSSRPPHCPTIQILPVLVVEEEDPTNEKYGSRRYCAEPRLPDEGPFEKYCNNTGQWDEEIMDETLLRFVDFTYRVTSGYLMVVDLQGVKSIKNNSYVLTDPVILCKDILRFGNTNLGEPFMLKCIDSTRAYMKERGWATRETNPFMLE